MKLKNRISRRRWIELMVLFYMCTILMLSIARYEDFELGNYLALASCFLMLFLTYCTEFEKVLPGEVK